MNNKTQQLEDLAFSLACKQAKDENEFLTDSDAQSFIKNLLQ
jgi:hypothetical protein